MELSAVDWRLCGTLLAENAGHHEKDESDCCGVGKPHDRAQRGFRGPGTVSEFGDFGFQALPEVIDVGEFHASCKNGQYGEVGWFLIVR